METPRLAGDDIEEAISYADMLTNAIVYPGAFDPEVSPPTITEWGFTTVGSSVQVNEQTTNIRDNFNYAAGFPTVSIDGSIWFNMDVASQVSLWIAYPTTTELIPFVSQGNGTLPDTNQKLSNVIRTATTVVGQGPGGTDYVLKEVYDNCFEASPCPGFYVTVGVVEGNEPTGFAVLTQDLS